MRLEYQWPGAFAVDLVPEVAVDCQLQRAPTVGTLRVDGGRDILLEQSPLHEGRDYRVLPSGPIETLAGTEAQSMRRSVDGHRKGPRDGFIVVAHQEKEILLQLFEDFDDP